MQFDEFNNPLHRLTIAGKSLFNGSLNIIEASGTIAGASTGSIMIDHENNGGASSIVFRSKVNRDNDFGYIQYQDSSSVGASGENARLIIGTQNETEDNLILQPNNGNVGIGTNTPSQKLTVQGNMVVSGFINANNINIGDILVNNSLNANNISVGIGNMSDLSVQTLRMGANNWHTGSGKDVFFFGSDGRSYYRGHNNIPHSWIGTGNTIIMELFANGVLRSIGAYQNVSDERIKKDIVDIDDTEALDKILLIQPKKYKYIDEETKGTHEVIGFIAQQVKSVLPHAVDLGEGRLPNGEIIQDFHFLDKSTIFSLNVAATQQLHRMILHQQTVIDSLIARIQTLEGV